MRVVSAPNNRRDPARAFFLCLVVLVQLLLPTAFARAHATYADGCVTLGSAGDDGKSKASDHGPQCAHCRPEAVGWASPIEHPQIAVEFVGDVVAEHEDHAIVEANELLRPPPTGPPALVLTA